MAPPANKGHTLGAGGQAGPGLGALAGAHPSLQRRSVLAQISLAISSLQGSPEKQVPVWFQRLTFSLYWLPGLLQFLLLYFLFSAAAAAVLIDELVGNWDSATVRHRKGPRGKKARASPRS